MVDEPDFEPDPEADAEAERTLRERARTRRRLLVGGAAVLVVLLIVVGTLIGGSLRDVPWLAVVALLILLAAIWRVELRRG